MLDLGDSNCTIKKSIMKCVRMFWKVSFLILIGLAYGCGSKRYYNYYSVNVDSKGDFSPSGKTYQLRVGYGEATEAERLELEKLLPLVRKTMKLCNFGEVSYNPDYYLDFVIANLPPEAIKETVYIPVLGVTGQTITSSTNASVSAYGSSRSYWDGGYITSSSSANAYGNSRTTTQVSNNIGIVGVNEREVTRIIRNSTMPD